MDHYTAPSTNGSDLGSITIEDLQRRIGHVGAEQAVADALEWVGCADAATREAGFMTLGLAALNHRPALDALIEASVAGCVDQAVEVRVAVAWALGQQSDQPACVPLLLGMMADPDTWVRQQAVAGLPITVGDPSADHPAVTTVVDLLADDNAIVQDWAAFALGIQWEVDSPAIRQGLRALLGKPDTEQTYPAAEAALGLAHRGDEQVWAVIADRLTQPGVGRMWLQAAAELTDPRLLPALLGLRAPDNQPDDPWVEDLERAIGRCNRPQDPPAPQ